MIEEEVDYTTVPVRYNGQIVSTHKELKDLIQIDSFQDVIGHIRKIRHVENVLSLPESERDPVNRIDPKFFNLVNESRPVGMYYEQTIGDKLLFLKRIDGLQYDII